MPQKITILRWPVFIIIVAAIFLTDCSGKKTVEKETVQKKPPVPEKKPAENKPTPAQEEQLQAESEAAQAAEVEIPQELTISIPEQEIKIGVVLPKKEGSFPTIKPVEAKQEAENILTVINRLEETYENDDFEGWQSILTPDYRRKYSNPESLQKDGWDANDLHSFFDLLVETRQKGQIKTLEISRVVFVNPNKAYVYVFFQDREFPEPQHTFIRIDGEWLKGLQEEEG